MRRGEENIQPVNTLAVRFFFGSSKQVFNVFICDARSFIRARRINRRATGWRAEDASVEGRRTKSIGAENKTKTSTRMTATNKFLNGMHAIFSSAAPQSRVEKSERAERRKRNETSLQFRSLSTFASQSMLGEPCAGTWRRRSETKRMNPKSSQSLSALCAFNASRSSLTMFETVKRPFRLERQTLNANFECSAPAIT